MCCAFEVRLEVAVFIIRRLAIIPLQVAPGRALCHADASKAKYPSYKLSSAPFYRSGSSHPPPNLSAMVEIENTTTESLKCNFLSVCEITKLHNNENFNNRIIKI